MLVGRSSCLETSRASCTLRASEQEGKTGQGQKNVRLGLALGASEPCHGAEDDDEDDADEETPAMFRGTVSDAQTGGMRLWADLPVCHCEEM